MDSEMPEAGKIALRAAAKIIEIGDALKALGIEAGRTITHEAIAIENAVYGLCGMDPHYDPVRHMEYLELQQLNEESEHE